MRGIENIMLRVVEAFSGIGSQAKALKNLGIEHEISNIIEWDINAFYAYDIIHNGPQDLSSYKEWDKHSLLERLSQYPLSSDGKAPIKLRYLRMWPEDALKRVLCAIERTKNLVSITEVTANHLPYEIDLFTYSFPCQDLSICGSWHGNMSGIDRNVKNRSGMLWEVERILMEIVENNRPRPKFLLMENVSNILSKKHLGNFEEWQSYLENNNYVNQIYTLNACDFGMPQRRVRTYMLSVYCPDEEKRKVVKYYLDLHNLEKKDKRPDRPLDPLEKYLRVDYDSNMVYRREAEECNPNDTPSRRKIYEENEKIFDGADTFAKVVNTLTTKQDRNPTSGLIEYPNHLPGKAPYRNLTPRECFLLMGFEEQDFDRLVDSTNDFNIKKDKKIFTRDKLMKLAGNSIVVNVLEAIFEQVQELKEFLWDEDGVTNTYSKKNELTDIEIEMKASELKAV